MVPYVLLAVDEPTTDDVFFSSSTFLHVEAKFLMTCLQVGALLKSFFVLVLIFFDVDVL